MIDIITQILAGVPPWLAVIITAMIPVGELRGALPIALLVYQFPIISAIALSVLGNILPVYFLLVFFESVSNWLSKRSSLAERLFSALYTRTQRKLEKQVKKYGFLALTVFVAIPLPMTGAWSGALAAFVFGISRTKAFMAILLGIIISSIIVTAVTLGASFTVRSFFS